VKFSIRHLVSFSGGACSFWAAKRVIEKYGREGVVLLFADTLIEDEDLYRFNQEATAHLGVPFVRILDGRSPWEVFIDEKMIGNHRADICSRVLKRELLWAWTREHCLEMITTVHLGLTHEEPDRLEDVRDHNPEWRIEAPMQWGRVMLYEEMLSGLEALGIKPPRLYSLGFPHNNCGGFCVKAGISQFVHLLITLPERYRWHEEQEEKARAIIGGDFSILRDRRGGKTKPLTLRTLRLRHEAGEKLPQFEWGGCGCAYDFERKAA